MAEEDFVEVSDEEKLAIVSQFLLSSPPGQINDVLKDVQALCPGDLLSDSFLQGVFRKYNRESAQVIGSVVCDEATGIDDDLYVDSNTQQVVRIDNVAQMIVEEGCVTVPSVPSNVLEKQQAVQAQIEDYVKSQYLENTATVNVACSENGTELVVLISGQKLNLKNYWSGRLRSRFTINLNSQQMTGSIKIRVHYFENGNVQMTTDRTFEGLSANGKDAKALATAVRAQISGAESKVHESLEDMYNNMTNETFKDMRRVLPITRQKMDWSGAQMQLAKGFTK